MTYFHGTNADLKVGDILVPGVELGVCSNHGRSEHVYLTRDDFSSDGDEAYFTAVSEAYAWARAACMVAEDEGTDEFPQAFVYIVEPLGPVMDDDSGDEGVGEEAVRTAAARIVGFVDAYELQDYRPAFGKDYLLI